MKETTVLDKINKLIDNINYKSIYVEINTSTNRYILEKENNRIIGFDTTKVNKSRN